MQQHGNRGSANMPIHAQCLIPVQNPPSSSSSSSLLLSSLELSDTQVYEPEIRALLGTASHLETPPSWKSDRKRIASSYASLRLTDFSQVDMLGLRFNLVNSGAVIDSGCRESRRCSRDTYPESYITKYTSIRRAQVHRFSEPK